MPGHRLFFALTPTDATRARVEALAATLPSTGGRDTRTDKMHLTLAFLGDADPATALRAGAKAAPQAQHFEFALDETDSFHGGTWILRAPATPFAALLAALRRELHAVGLHEPDEQRAFLPHLTLRRRAGARLPRAAVAPIPWLARSLCLYDSDLAAGRYTRLGEWPLAGADAVSS